MSYDPKPIPTEGVELPESLLELLERLSEHNHDHWALRRLREGWTYGESRDDERKTHPGLRRYDELSEGEKEYDRTSVLETLRAILQLGYRLER